MFDVRNVGSPTENFENLIRASRKPAPNQGEFAMEMEAARIFQERDAEFRKQQAEQWRGEDVFLPKIRGAERMGREISRQAEKAAASRLARMRKDLGYSEETRSIPSPVGPLNQQAPTPRPF